MSMDDIVPLSVALLSVSWAPKWVPPSCQHSNEEYGNWRPICSSSLRLTMLFVSLVNVEILYFFASE